ncbi:MAG: STAS domain-containing protein [Chitinophagales bacterium]|nr:STAS domain-containing protein [Chitinophagales bacterium]
MDIVQMHEGDVLDIVITGQLDANSAIKLDDVIKEAIKQRKTKITINCVGLSYISSAGLGVFISHLDDMKSYGGKFVFYDMSESVFSVFKILGLHTIMEIVENRGEAKMLMDEG